MTPFFVENLLFYFRSESSSRRLDSKNEKKEGGKNQTQKN
jgi:hypothetical protein